MNVPTLESERLSLKPLTTAFCTAEYVSWLNDPEVNRYMETRGDYTIDKLREFLQEVEKQQILFWAIVIRSSGKHIGNIKIDTVDNTDKSCEYGIMMGDRSEWGKGYAREATVLVIDYCFRQLGMDSIKLGVISNNAAAVNLYKSLGFETTSVKKNAGLYNGEWCDSLRMQLSDKNLS